MSNIAFHIDDLPWEPVRPGVATGVFGKTLLTEPVKMVLTRVEPGGGFASHVDPYGHLLQVLEGEGTATVAGEEFPLGKGSVLRIPARVPHAYRNSGPGELILISMNIPA